MIRRPGLPIETGNDFVQPSTSRRQAARSRIRAASVAGMYCSPSTTRTSQGISTQATGARTSATSDAPSDVAPQRAEGVREAALLDVARLLRKQDQAHGGGERLEAGDRRLGRAEVADLGDRGDDAERERSERVPHRDERRADARLEHEAEQLGAVAADARSGGPGAARRAGARRSRMRTSRGSARARMPTTAQVTPYWTPIATPTSLKIWASPPKIARRS